MCHPSARCMFTCSFVVTTQPTIEGLRFTQITPNTNEAFNFNLSFPNVCYKVYTSYSFYQSAFYDSRCLKLCSLFVPVSTCSAHVVKQQLKSCYFNVPLEAIGSHSVMLSLRKRCLAFYVNLILLFMETAHILAVSVTAALNGCERHARHIHSDRGCRKTTNDSSVMWVLLSQFLWMVQAVEALACQASAPPQPPPPHNVYWVW